MTKMIDLRHELYDQARRLGAVETLDDCVGGDLGASDDAGPEQVKAVEKYRLACREHWSRVYGPQLREYYFERPTRSYDFGRKPGFA